MIWKLRVRFKRWLSTRWRLTEFCKRCGITQPIVWQAPDDLWLKVNGRPGGVLCPICFTTLARRQGLLIFWEVSAVARAHT